MFFCNNVTLNMQREQLLHFYYKTTIISEEIYEFVSIVNMSHCSTLTCIVRPMCKVNLTFENLPASNFIISLNNNIRQ